MTTSDTGSLHGQQGGGPAEVEVPRHTWTSNRPTNGRWSRPDVEALHQAFDNEVGRAAITLIAHRSLEGKQTSYKEILDHVDIGHRQFSPRLTSLGKKATASKGTVGGDNVWPLTLSYHGSQAPKYEHYSYRMPDAIACWWLEQEEGRPQS